MNIRGVACLCLAWFVLNATCRGDGGTIQFSGVSQGLQISVFTNPGVPSSGPVDLSVLVQDASTHAAVLDAEVHASLRPETPDRRASAWAPPLCAATSISNLQSFRLDHTGAQNRLYYAALVQIPSAGKWHLSLDVRQGNRNAVVEAPLEVASQGAPWASYWHLFLFPLVAIGLFAAIQRRIASRGARRAFPDPHSASESA
jgi:hypothetical protein